MESKEVDARLEMYLDVAQKAKARISDPEVVASVVQEMGKDVRCDRVQRQQDPSTSPMTEKQRRFIQELGSDASDLTRREASRLIDQLLEERHDD